MSGDRFRGPERRSVTLRRVPAVFLAHGSPNTVLDDEYGTALRRFGAQLGSLDGVVVVSAHWESLRPVRVTSGARPELLYDFSGMPSRIDRMSFACKGSPALAARIVASLEAAGVAAVADSSRGFDHGTWVPMSLMFPTGRVPIVQVSLPVPAQAEDVMALGRALAPLRDQQILLVGSGGIVHNLHRLRFTDERQEPEPWALGFDAWIRERLASLDVDTLRDYRRRAPHALESAPTDEHFNPLLFILGASRTGDRLRDIYEGFRYGSLSMSSFALTGRRREDPAGLIARTPERSR